MITSTRFDLALIDAVLPGVSGIELAELAANENIPALLTSGHPEVCQTLDRFHFPHLKKPFDLDALVAEARSIMRETEENIRRVQSSAAEMRAKTEALKASGAEARRLLATMKPGTISQPG